MIEFMIIAPPRSGTTWAANWLTTEKSMCLHDPLFERHYKQLDTVPCDRLLGLSCTGLMWFADWLNAHPARKVILHRKESEVNDSLAELGLPLMPPHFDHQLDAVRGVHKDWTALFDDPVEIYEHLLEQPFDRARHTNLRAMHIQPAFEKLQVNAAAARKVFDEMRGAPCSE